MALEVREIRAEELDAAVAFAQSAGSALSAAQVIASLSLVAGEDNSIVASLLSEKHADGSYEMELALAEGQDEAVAQRLINIALMKMRGSHIGISRIRRLGSADDRSLWSAVNWTLGELTDDGASEAA